jgi:phosphate transport system permease protein
MSAIADTKQPEAPGVAPARKRFAVPTDRIYLGFLFMASLSVLLIIAAVAFELVVGSRPSLHAFGGRFLITKAWDPVAQHFGGLSFILGTLYTSFMALLVAVPLSVGAAIYIAEIAPRWIRVPVAFLVELLAAIPSVVYGLWGVFVLAPWLVAHVETPISNNAKLAALPLFSAPPNGNDWLSASLILAIMVTPFITAVSSDILRAIPRAAREGSYALGATRWETITRVVLPFARSGIVGGVVLGLGRALGETMAVTMVIGNNTNFQIPLFSPGYTMSSIIANEFTEASFTIYRSALIEIALCLFVVTMIVNGIARALIYYTARNLEGVGR